MVNRAEVFDHIESHFPLTELGQLGEGLGSGRWDRDREFTQLGSVLICLNPEKDLTAVDFEALEATSGQLSSPEVMPLTINAVRRGIIYRNLPLEAEVSPAIEEEWRTEDSNGIRGDSGKIDALGAGILLTSFINGLATGGFSKQKSKAILREQFEHVLKTECEGKSSYTAVGAMRHLYRVMKYAELHNAETRLTQIRRGAYLVKNFGLVLSDF